jgi:hypothetical protein
MNKRQLIIIPGLGDHDRLYRFFVPLWQLFGFQVKIFGFGWEDHSDTFDVAFKRLITYIDGLNGEEFLSSV